MKYQNIKIFHNENFDRILPSANASKLTVNKTLINIKKSTLMTLISILQITGDYRAIYSTITI